MLLYLLNGSLPWSNLIIKNQQDKFAKVLEIKLKFKENHVNINQEL